MKILKRPVAFLLTPILLLGGAGLATAFAAPANAADTPVNPPAIAKILADTNAVRANAGMPPLVENAAMDQVAQNWSKEQSDRGYTGDEDLNTLGSQIPAGYSLVAMNAAGGYTYDNAVAGWTGSPGHYSNMVNNFTDIGIGFYDLDGTAYATQVFANYSTTKTIPGRAGTPTVTGGVKSISATYNAPTATGNLTNTFEVRATPTDGGNPVSVTSTTTKATITGLVPGVTYNVDVRAVNAQGPGAWSPTASATVNAGPPSEPSIGNISVTSGTATVNWAGDDGGSAITSWNFVLDGITNQNVTNNTITINNLQPATNYTGRVSATNALGTSSAAEFSFETATAPPSVPRNVTLVQDGTKAQVIASWNTPADNGGGTILGYTAVVTNTDSGSVVATQNVTGLSATFAVTKGSHYQVAVTAKNSAGSSDAVPSTIVNVPTNVASAPQNVVATLTDEQFITVTYDQSTDDGGSSILRYVVSGYANGSSTPSFQQNFTPGNGVAQFSANDGVKAGTNYVVKVVAVNAVGNSIAGVSEEVKVPETPTAPDPVTGLQINNVTAHEADITWDAPSYNGGSALTGFRVTVSDGNSKIVKTVVGVDQLSYALSDLNRGAPYTVLIQAVNKYGDSVVATEDFTTKFEAPTAPANVTLIATGYDSAQATWDAPTDNGGNDIVSYTVEVFRNGTLADTKTVTANSLNLSGLAYGSDYTVEVLADNGQLKSDYSQVSNVLTTPTPPGLAENVTITVTDAHSAIVGWDAPTDEGTYAIQGYDLKVYKAGNDTPVYEENDPFTTNATAINGKLDPATQYYATVQTYSTITSGDVATSDTVTTPADVSGSPTDLKLNVVSPTSIKASWIAPVNDNGSAITGYKVSVHNSTTGALVTSTVVNNATTNATLVDLTAATTYDVSVVSINAVGSSKAITGTVKTNAVAPDAPANAVVSYSGPDAQLVATWDAPASNGGSSILSYAVVLYNAKTNTVVSTKTVASGTTASFVGLVRNTSYYATVTATNSIGTSKLATSTTTLIPVVAPSSVQNLAVKADASNNIKATWAAPADNGGTASVTYDAVLSLDGKTVSTVTVTTPTVTFSTGILPASDYTVTITAKNTAGSSDAVSKDVTTNAVAPGVVTNVTAVVDGTTVNATWDAPANNGGSAITGYVVSLVDNATGKIVSSFTTPTGLPVTFASFASLAHGASYTVNVAAANSVGTGAIAKSNVISVAAVKPSAVLDVTAKLNGEQSILVTWKAPADNGGSAITGYVVTTLDTDGNSVSTTVNGKNLSTVIKNLKGNTTYTVSVTAVNTVGNADTVFAGGNYLTAPTTAPAAPDEQTVVDNSTFKITQDGTKLYVTLPDVNAGTWVYGYAYSSPQALGRVLIGSNHVATFDTASASLEAGTHHLAVVDPTGTLVAAGAFTVAPAVVVTPPSSNPNPGNSTTGGQTGPTSTTSQTHVTPTGIVGRTLAFTGSYGTEPAGIAAGILILAGLVLVIGFNRKRRTLIETDNSES